MQDFQFQRLEKQQYIVLSRAIYCIVRCDMVPDTMNERTAREV